MLPAGLNKNETDKLELYAENGKAKALYRGHVVNFFELPTYLINVFRREMNFMPKRIKNLGLDKIQNENERLEAYIVEYYGDFDNTPDYNGETTNPEITNQDILQHYSISKREAEILKLIGEGLKVPEISEKLFISQKTVETHINNIKQKLSLNTSVALVRFTIKHKIVAI